MHGTINGVKSHMMKRNYRMSPLAPYINTSFVGDQFCGCNGQCCKFQCQEWINGKPCYPELERDERYGFAICPKCGVSYGRDAMTGEEYNRATAA
jgi:hypothetical protein